MELQRASCMKMLRSRAHAPMGRSCAVPAFLCRPHCVRPLLRFTGPRAFRKPRRRTSKRKDGPEKGLWVVKSLLALVACVAGHISCPLEAGSSVSAACVVDPPAIATVIEAIYTNETSCDVNADGVVSAADVTAAILRRFPAHTPSPAATVTSSTTATPTETESPTTPITETVVPTQTFTATTPSLEGDTETPTATVTETTTPTPSATATGTRCPAGGASLVIEIDNRSGAPNVVVSLNGQRVGTECSGAALAAYDEIRTCAGDGQGACLELTGLVPGTWRHSIRVLEPATGQEQHRLSLLVAGDPSNRLRFTVFASVFTVTTTANDGKGSLRKLIRDAEAVVKPSLIRFDPRAFPDGVPTTIALEFALPTLASDDVTIDATDATGAAGNRIVDAQGLPIGVLSITGARNHLIGLHLRNAGEGNRDVLNISGERAAGNVVERTIIEGSASADGIGVDSGAGSDFFLTANVIRDCEVRGAFDKGIKVTTGSWVIVENCWVHDNVNGGVQATLGGHVLARYNRIEGNRGGTAQNGLSANPSGEPVSGQFSELVTRGNIVRGNGSNGISVRGSVADIRHDYIAANGSSGLRVFNDVGGSARVRVEGVGAICNGMDGVVIADTSEADLGGGFENSRGHNAFTQNNLPAGGANLRNATGLTVSAVNNQWENCGNASMCDEARIAAFDLSDRGARTRITPAQAHRAQQPVVTEVFPRKGRAGERLRIFGSGFNAIDGHFAEGSCTDVVGRNRCVPLRGNCVRIGGVSAPVEAVTPTMLVVRWPFTCIGPVPLVVTVDHGAAGASSEALVVCTDEG